MSQPMNSQSAVSQSTTRQPIVSHSTTGQAADSQPATSQQPSYAPWLTAMLGIARHYRIESSEENIRINLDWGKNHFTGCLATQYGAANWP